MKKILILGAGKSATLLIEYLLTQASIHQWQVIVADQNMDIAAQKVHNHICGKAVALNVQQAAERMTYIQQSDVVISLLPPTLHYLIAKDCIEYSKHLLTASYVDENIKGLQKDIEHKGLLFLCEMGLDPGIDHMSAMQAIHKLQEKGATIHSFISHCGGLVAPESDDNPWHYKVSWNPRNVVMAGKAGASYKEDGVVKAIGYHELFNAKRTVEICDAGVWSWYPNRDSISYAKIYGLEKLSTFIRTTLRHTNFMYGWKALIHAGCTAENKIYDTSIMSCNTFLDLYFKNENDVLLKELISSLYIKNDKFLNKRMCAAIDILQSIIEHQWTLQPNDKDMILMMHDIRYTLNNEHHQLKSCLIVKGKNCTHTAMAKTVGLPLAIAATLLLEGKLNINGLHIPITPAIYNPVLDILKEHRVLFKEYYFK